MRSVFMLVAVLLCTSVFLFAQGKVTVEQSPNKSSTVYHVSDAPFDLQFSYDLTVVTGAAGNAGAEFDGAYYYSTRWASNLLHKVDMTGVLVEQFSIPGVTGLRDLAYDGAFMYGGAAATTIYQMDFTTKTLIGTIPSPVAVRFIAYDEAADAFWVGTWNTPPTLVSRTGVTLGTVTSGLLSQYGAAYDKWTSGGPYLWMFDQGAGAGTPQYVHQINLNTGTPTGVTYDVLSDFLPNASAIAGGLWTSEGVVAGKASLGGVLQGTPDMYFVYELADAGAPTDPMPPTNFTAYSDYTTPTTMALNWTSPSTYINGNPLPAGTTIKISRDGSQIASVPLATQNYTDTGLNNGTLYSYQIWADDGLGAVSAPANASWYAGGSPVPSAPTNLAGTGTTTNATLTWTDPTTQEDGTPLDDLAKIRIYRNGAQVGEVNPGVQTYIDTPPPGFIYTYTVTAVDNEVPPNESDPSLPAQVFVGGLPNILIWVGPGALGASAASGDSIFEALAANGESCYLTNNLFEFGSDLTVYEAIFVVLGIFANNHTILATDPEGAALEAYLTAGGHIYLEGGDCFNYDPLVGGYNIQPWFGLNPGNDGSGDLFGIIGLNDLSAFAFSYTGENNWMDELAPATSIPVWQNNANADISGVFYAGFAPGSGRTIGVVPSFGGLVDSPEPLNPVRRTLENYFPQELAGNAVKPPRTERTAPAPFTKKAAYYPERKVIRSPENPLYKITPNGVETLANTKEDLMAAYLYFFRSTTTPPEITVDPLSLSETLVAGNSSTQTLSITNSGGILAGDLTWSISEVPAVGWLEVNPTNGVTTGGSTSNVDVIFTANVAPGNYSASLQITSNAGNVTVSVSLTVQQGAVMSVSPLTLDVTLPQGATQDETITISNTGDQPLDFTVAIVPLTAASTKVTVKTRTVSENTPRAVSNPNPAAAYDLAEATGSPAAKLDPNYRHPRASELSVLYDNGPLVNLPGGGFGGADASVLQSAIGLNVYGFGHAVASGFRVADDFTVPAGGWIIDKISFFAYQTGSTTTSTINNVNFRIWDGPPGDPGSNVVFGDITTNRLTATSFSNIYRSIDTAPLGNTRPIMKDECGGVGLFLAPGTYWLDWQTGGTLASGPWAPPITINGVTVTGNGLQYDPTAMVWNPLIDSGTALAQQGLPFIIEGTAANFWLSVGTTAGTVPAGGNVNVTVTFDADTLPGDYYADIVVSGNDANNPSDVVNAHMEVTGGCTVGLLGDINGDDAVNSLDALLMLSYDAALPLPQPFLDRIAIGFGDVTEDGLTNSTDALVTLSWEVGFPVPFPVGTVVCLPAPAALGKSTLPPAAEGTEVNAYAVLNLSGQTLEVPVMIDLAKANEKLGSYTMTLTWNPALLEFTGFSGGVAEGFAEPVVNDLNAKQGRLVAAHAYPQGGEGEVNVLNARFTLKGSAEALSGNPVSLGFSAMAAAQSFTNLLPALKVLDNVATGLTPTAFALENYPNPFNPATEIRYQLPEAVDVQILVYNLLGQKVQTLVNGKQQAGVYTVRWEGVNEQNQPVPSGMYFLRMKAGKFVADRKLLLLK